MSGASSHRAKHRNVPIQTDHADREPLPEPGGGEVNTRLSKRISTRQPLFRTEKGAFSPSSSLRAAPPFAPPMLCVDPFAYTPKSGGKQTALKSLIIDRKRADFVRNQLLTHRNAGIRTRGLLDPNSTKTAEIPAKTSPLHHFYITSPG